MTTEKMLEVVKLYRGRLRWHKIPKERADIHCCFGSLTREQILAHAHYLLDGLEEYARDPKHYGKANRHLTAVQMCLSFAGWYTLEELMNHNRP